MQLLHAFFSARGNIVRIDSCTDDTIRVSLTVGIRFTDASVNRYTPSYHWGNMASSNWQFVFAHVVTTYIQHLYQRKSTVDNILHHSYSWRLNKQCKMPDSLLVHILWHFMACRLMIKCINLFCPPSLLHALGFQMPRAYYCKSTDWMKTFHLQHRYLSGIHVDCLWYKNMAAWPHPEDWE